MKYGVLSDIHGNLEAFNSVLDDMNVNGIKSYLCIGDIVGYGADPNICVEKVRALNCLIALGNHDAVSVGLISLAYFTDDARESAIWTSRYLKDEYKVFLREFPLEQVYNNILLVHSSPKEPDKWHYLFNLSEIVENFNYFTQGICFTGHFHRPFIAIKDESGEVRQENTHSIAINSKYKYIVNAGSVGQPRDGNPQACYVIYDDTDNTLEIKRVVYDVETTKQKIIKAGLPRKLADRLSLGR